MQMYEGLPIVTNKIPVEDQKGIPHHLLDFLNVFDTPWRVDHYVPKAVEVVCQRPA